MEIVSLAAVDQMNQGIERREAANAAFVLILGGFIEEVGRTGARWLSGVF